MLCGDFILILLNADIPVFMECQAAVTPGVQIRNQCLQHLAALYFIPDLRVNRLFVRRGFLSLLILLARLRSRNNFEHVEADIRILIQLDICMVKFRKAIDTDAAYTTL